MRLGLLDALRQGRGPCWDLGLASSPGESRGQGCFPCWGTCRPSRSQCLAWSMFRNIYCMEDGMTRKANLLGVWPGGHCTTQNAATRTATSPLCTRQQGRCWWLSFERGTLRLRGQCPVGPRSHSWCVAEPSLQPKNPLRGPEPSWQEARGK